MIQLPTVEPMMLWLYAGVLGLLIVASLIGFVLARRVTSDERPRHRPQPQCAHQGVVGDGAASSRSPSSSASR